jgi:cytochrome c553
MKRLVAYALLGALAAALVVLSGVIPLKASAGHWAVTTWLLDFTKRRSVATHSIGIEVPPLDDPALILRGAGHYELGCRPCHGAPDGRPPAIPVHMLPPPPDLKRQAARWTAAEQFTIVRHGIKFTGMPAWPAPTREDEVWAVVAFLQRLPSLDAAGYDRLVLGPIPSTVPSTAPSAAPSAAASDTVTDLVRARCDRCHGADGRGREQAAFPRLAGQKAAYLRMALTAYAEGRRHSGTMSPVAAALDAPTIAAVADHYAALPASAAGSASPAAAPGGAAEAALRGGDIARLGIPAQGVPRCVECHGPAATKRNEAYPRLAGQFGPYLEQQLQLLAEGRRGGSPFVHLMHVVAPRLTPDQRRDVAAWFASLPPMHPTEP